ncbi:MAG: HD domain-containing protein, partial [Planctomycetota bacterium]
FWPDELMRSCRACGNRFANPENSLKCLEWCRYAAQCMAAIRGEDETWIGPLRGELIERMKAVFGNDEKSIKHALAVLELAEEIGREVGADPLVLVPAAILHDIGRAESLGGGNHGEGGSRAAAGLLADLAIPGAVEREILGLIEHHHDRDRMEGVNGSALFDADLIVNLREDAGPDWEAVLGEQALTEAGKRIATRELSR